MEFLFFLVVGVCVGTFGTLIGLGGGLILVPLFMYTMYAPDGSMTFSTVQQIIGTSLFAVACNAVSGAYAYMKQKRIMFRAAIPFALSTIPGAFCGSFVSKFDVPMMVFILGFPAQIATASSTFILMVSSLVGTVSHASLGHIIWVPAVCIGCGCVIGAQIGARIAKKSKPRIIVVILSVTMVLMGINLVVQGL